jgi:peptidoglycan/xylan/chitin deacetylase (PgdA/CDA1 family)
MTQAIPARGRWVPSPLLCASAGLHAAAAAVTIVRPGFWPFTLGAVAVNQLLLAGVGLWPRSQLLGPNWTRLPAHSAGRGAVAITIDDGPDPEVTPRVLSLLDDCGARATFFCVGERVERHAELAREVVHRGHTIENHSYRHLHSFSLLGPRGMLAEISRAQECITRVTGSKPCFFRAPAGLRNPFLEPVLVRLQLRLASWTRRGFDTVNGNPEAVFNRLSRALTGGDILLLHDGNCARMRGGGAVILEVLPRLLATLDSLGLAPVTLRSALT